MAQTFAFITLIFPQRGRRYLVGLPTLRSGEGRHSWRSTPPPGSSIGIHLCRGAPRFRSFSWYWMIASYRAFQVSFESHLRALRYDSVILPRSPNIRSILRSCTSSSELHRSSDEFQQLVCPRESKTFLSNLHEPFCYFYTLFHCLRLRKDHRN